MAAAGKQLKTRYRACTSAMGKGMVDFFFLPSEEGFEYCFHVFLGNYGKQKKRRSIHERHNLLASLYCKFFAAFSSSAANNVSAGSSLHSGTETVFTFSFAATWLIGN